MQEQENDQTDDFADLQIRVSQRAKYLQLKVLYDGQVELVLPKRYNQAQALAFVKQHKGWLEQKRAHYIEHRCQHPERFASLPGFIDFKASNEHWSVIYNAAEKKSVTEHSHLFNQLLIAYSNEDEQKTLVRNWFFRKSKCLLLPWFDAVSTEIGLSYNKVSIRGQKTRWGSCTSEKNISLNRCLMFLPPALVKYVFIHELCHTRYLDHSKKFWRLVKKIDPDYELHDRKLNEMSSLIPLWAL